MQVLEGNLFKGDFLKFGMRKGVITVILFTLILVINNVELSEAAVPDPYEACECIQFIPNWVSHGGFFCGGESGTENDQFRRLRKSKDPKTACIRECSGPHIIEYKYELEQDCTASQGTCSSGACVYPQLNTASWRDFNSPSNGISEVTLGDNVIMRVIGERINGKKVRYEIFDQTTSIDTYETVAGSNTVDYVWEPTQTGSFTFTATELSKSSSKNSGTLTVSQPPPPPTQPNIISVSWREDTPTRNEISTINVPLNTPIRLRAEGTDLNGEQLKFTINPTSEDVGTVTAGGDIVDSNTWSTGVEGVYDFFSEIVGIADSGKTSGSLIVGQPPIPKIDSPLDDSIWSVNEEIAFTQSSSDDSGSFEYTWNFGDGIIIGPEQYSGGAGGSNYNPIHTFTSGGTKTITLTVDDGVNPSVSDRITLEIQKIPENCRDYSEDYSGIEGYDMVFLKDKNGDTLSERVDDVYGDPAGSGVGKIEKICNDDPFRANRTDSNREDQGGVLSCDIETTNGDGNNVKKLCRCEWFGTECKLATIDVCNEQFGCGEESDEGEPIPGFCQESVGDVPECTDTGFHDVTIERIWKGSQSPQSVECSQGSVTVPCGRPVVELSFINLGGIFGAVLVLIMIYFGVLLGFKKD
jgi:hypothetical protein